MFKRILVPLDGSRFAAKAIRHAVDLASNFGSEIILVQVVTRTLPLDITDGMTPGFVDPKSVQLNMESAIAQDKRNLTQARRSLSRQVNSLKAQNINASYRALYGRPAETIKKLAKKEKVDLIVMTSHGKSGIKRAVMGSVADEVIRESGKLVLVMHPKVIRRK